MVDPNHQEKMDKELKWPIRDPKDKGEPRLIQRNVIDKQLNPRHYSVARCLSNDPNLRSNEFACLESVTKTHCPSEGSSTQLSTCTKFTLGNQSSLYAGFTNAGLSTHMARPLTASVLDTSQPLNRSPLCDVTNDYIVDSPNHNAKTNKKCDKFLIPIIDSGCTEVLRRESLEFFRNSVSQYPRNSNIVLDENNAGQIRRKSSVLHVNTSSNMHPQMPMSAYSGKQSPIYKENIAAVSLVTPVANSSSGMHSNTSQPGNISALSDISNSNLLSPFEHGGKRKKTYDDAVLPILDSSHKQGLRKESFEFFTDCAMKSLVSSSITTKKKEVGNRRKSSTLQGNLNPNRSPQTSLIDNSNSNGFIDDINAPFPISGSEDDECAEEINTILSSVNSEGFLDIGDPIYKCKYCGALMWYDERTKKDRYPVNPEFSLCCMNGKIQLPLLKPAPDLLTRLHRAEDNHSSNFLRNIRAYNMMFAFTSFGGKVDSLINQGSNPPIFRLGGQNHHYVGSLLPASNESPKFAQLYIFDTDNEIENRLKCFRSRQSESLDAEIIIALKTMLDQNNVVAQSFRYARDRFQENNLRGIKMRLIRHRNKDGRIYNLPSASEVAALVVGDIDGSIGDRDIIIETQSRLLQRIDVHHPLYLALQYPLLFPYGEDGYRNDVMLNLPTSSKSSARKTVSMREFFTFRLQNREEESQLLLVSRKLFQQFLVDAYTMIEAERLNFLKYNQTLLRADLYKGLNDALSRGEKQASATGKRIVLPSSFTGGPRYMSENCKDAFAICRWAGYPSLFITITCNPKWPEIMRFVSKRHLRPEDRPDILCRVFKMKLDHLLNDLKSGHIFGAVLAYTCTIEFQKRGLPHAHILLWLHPDDRPKSAEDLDKIISAEIPDEILDPELHAIVKACMMHGPCGRANPKSPCMKGGKSCTKHFPRGFCSRTTIDEEGFPHYRRRDNERTMNKKGVELDNRYVVPYNPKLLLKYRAHINVEYTCQTNAIKYLFKYIHKGNDRVTAVFTHSEGNRSTSSDEIQRYYDCRYVSACEAAWRIFAFPIHYRSPSVQRLSFHLKDKKFVIYKDNDDIEEVLSKVDSKKTMFEAWMEANRKFDYARELSYAEFPTKFVYNEQKREWTNRKKGFAIGRIAHVPPGIGEEYYLRILLNFQKGCRSYEEIRTIDGTVYPNFKEACYSLGLLDDDKEYIDAINEAHLWGRTAQYLRQLFASLLYSKSMSRPEHVWNSCWKHLSEDILHHQRQITERQDLLMSDEEIKNNALAKIEKILQGNGKSLDDFPCMPKPNGVIFCGIHNKLILDELCYDRASLSEELKKYLSCLTDEQRKVYDTIMQAATENRGGLFFLYGFGGTGKTFVWKTLSASFRSRGQIVLNVASSGIAAELLPGGRTAHSRLAIPIDINENSTCNIKKGTPLAEMLSKTKLIIWDEAPMSHRFCFEALDKSLRDILDDEKNEITKRPFGGIIVVLGGDFRQILPVVPYGGRQEIVHATINSSYLWDYCQVLTLTKNLRLQAAPSNQNLVELREFSEWLLKVGDGEIGDDADGESIIEIPEEMLIKDKVNGLAELVAFVYPDFLSRIKDQDIKFFQERSILSPTVKDVAMLNDHLMSSMSSVEKSYLSSDSVCKDDLDYNTNQQTYSPEVLNTFTASGFPDHKVTFKVGIPVMLLRNVDQSNGLCNGTRLLITRLGNHVVEGKVLSGKSAGQSVFIPRVVMTPSNHSLPVKFQRRQFPLVKCFAMTINKSQGQTLSHVGIYLPRSVFSHGQLYVALSRVKSKHGLKILSLDVEGSVSKQTTNIVFKEVFHRLN